MMKDRGVALVWVLFLMLLLSILGTSVLYLSLSDLRISSHLVGAEKAQYAAEAGVEMMVGELMAKFADWDGSGWVMERAVEPAFSVTAVPLGADVVRIRSTGQAEGKERVTQADAYLRPLGKHALLGKEAVLEGVRVSGHLLADEVVFRGRESTVDGEIRTKQLYEDGDPVACSGHICGDGKPFTLAVDFDDLEGRALFEGWPVPPGESGSYWLDDTVAAGCLFVPGHLVISEGHTFEGLLVVRGSVSVEGWPAGSRMVVLAEGEVVLSGDSGVWEGSMLVYSGEAVTRYGSEMLVMAGVLAAPVLELACVEIRYCDRAAVLLLQHLPVEVYTFVPTFDLVWADVGQRR